ncbi:spore germination protein [Paenibacillus sp. S150]|uniref:spore germination protein n=1 Tax=Paenibacillus sp. S150 TaxID=2749826 RepID=UPI001C59B7DF|nr:spore germination protein [Paenibacillus sp. S150]MBW4082920.1 spore germination protein [Paenibacillus sp. S150]
MATQTTDPKPSQTADSSNQSAPLSANLEDNLQRIREGLGNSLDLIIRHFETIDNALQLAAVYMEGITDKEMVDDFMNHAMSFQTVNEAGQKLSTGLEVYSYMKEKALNIGKVKPAGNMVELFEALLSGNTIILFEGLEEALCGNTSGGEVRPVSEAGTQVSIRGSKESFTETIGTNISLVRRKIKNPNLWVEPMTLGAVTQTNVAIMYLKGVANEDTIKKLKEKLQEIRVDSILESGYIEQLIEESGYSPFPTLYNTERPDSVAGNLLDGRIAVFVDGTPFVLIAPTTFFMFFHTVEDYYQRFDISTLIRLLRYLCLLISMFGPAVFVAALNFHQEMIPTPLLINLASQREGVPFPAFVEALMMEVTFEIIREAGIRLPSPIGQTVSIIGGLVLGQAAVQAGIVSPAMVIIVSLTGISSFTTPAFNMALSVRFLRFAIVFVAAFMGLYGIAILALMLVAHLCSLRSLGVPYMSPMAPLNLEDQKDTFIRSPIHFMKIRPRLAANSSVRMKADKGKQGNGRKQA